MNARQINRKLNSMGYDLELWYNRSGGTWVITGTNKNKQYFSNSVYVYRLNHLTFNEWIKEALYQFNKEN